MKTQTGFTLLELLTTVAVGAILMAIAIPNFRTTIQNNRMSAQLNTMLSGLIYARSEAIKRNVDVAICATTDQQTCAGSGTWGTGWLIYYTPSGSYNAPGSATNPLPGPTAAEIIRQYPALSGGNTLNTNAANNGAGIAAVSNGIIAFQPSGLALLNNDAQFTLCDTRGTSYARIIAVGATGRAEVLPGSAPTWSATTLSPSCP
jgi:type IV fimbrial biogenesis protein FimT